MFYKAFLLLADSDNVLVSLLTELLCYIGLGGDDSAPVSVFCAFLLQLPACSAQATGVIVLLHMAAFFAAHGVDCLRGFPSVLLHMLREQALPCEPVFRVLAWMLTATETNYSTVTFAATLSSVLTASAQTWLALLDGPVGPNEARAVLSVLRALLPKLNGSHEAMHAVSARLVALFFNAMLDYSASFDDQVFFAFLFSIPKQHEL